MAKVLDKILESFYAKLSESDTVNDATVTELRTHFSSGEKAET